MIKVEKRGNVSFYKGSREKERKVKEILSNGEVIYYSGERNEERAVRKVLPSGEEISYEEPQEERVVRTESHG